MGALTKGEKSLLEGELVWERAETSREWTRFKRASLRDLRRSFSISEHREVKDTPESEGISSTLLDRSTAVATEDEEKDGERGGVRVETLEAGEMLDSVTECEAELLPQMEE